MVTLKEIAEEANVSLMTVSNALNGRTRGVRGEAGKRVAMIQELAAKMGYRPNLAARAIASGQSNAISLLSSSNPHHNHLPKPLLESLHDELLKRDKFLIYSSVSDELFCDPEFLPEIMQKRFSDGIIFNYNYEIPETLLKNQKEMLIPSVWLNSGLDYNSVGPDECGGALEATRYLISLGHKRIAYADYMHSPDQLRDKTKYFFIPCRYNGYRQAMHEAGLADQLLIHVPDLPNGERRPVDTGWLDDPDRPTAVLLCQGEGVTAIRLAAEFRGLKVPDDLSLLTFADSTFYSAGIKIDAMLIDYKEIARITVEMLDKLIAEPKKEFPNQLVPFKLDSHGTVGQLRK